MVKRTLHFSNPAHLSTSKLQLIVELKDEQRTKHTVPIEDIGLMVLEHPQITFTLGLLDELLENKVALVTCNGKYMPNGLLLPLEGNTEQTERMHTQLNASLPLKKQLWQQTIKAKIHNQAQVLAAIGCENKRLLSLKDKVSSGDSSNCEAQAAAYYWGQLYGGDFVRSREKETPNAQLNYGYAILRSIVARSLTASGLLPTFGIHHKNKYNAYCLADDIMEPFRPYVDWMVLHLENIKENDEGLTKVHKIKLLELPQLDVMINDLKRPLFHAVGMTTASLYKCYSGEQRKIAYPDFHYQLQY
ncbi:MAG: hypothetical protein RL264_2316 [Bacteroidota bacterium]|jgi:CRISPR-associated protein Cas1